MESFGTENSPFPKEYLTGPNDQRLGCATPYIIDLSTNLIFEYHITNDQIYAGYSRLNFGSPTTYAVFEYFIPVAKRCPSKTHTLDLIVNSDEQSVSYKVDGKVVFKVKDIGYRLASRQFMTKDQGGTEEKVFPQVLWYGFGAVTAMDTYATCGNGVNCQTNHAALSQSQVGGLQAYDPAVGSPTIATYWDDAGLNANWVWGQGTKSVIKSIEVFFKELF